MRNLAALFLVNLLFIAANAVAAGVILALGTIANAYPYLQNSRMAWVVIGVLGVSAAVGFLFLVIRTVNRRRPAQDRGRGRG